MFRCVPVGRGYNSPGRCGIVHSFAAGQGGHLCMVYRVRVNNGSLLIPLGLPCIPAHAWALFRETPVRYLNDGKCRRGVPCFVTRRLTCIMPRDGCGHRQHTSCTKHGNSQMARAIAGRTGVTVRRALVSGAGTAATSGLAADCTVGNRLALSQGGNPLPPVRQPRRAAAFFAYQQAPLVPQGRHVVCRLVNIPRQGTVCGLHCTLAAASKPAGGGTVMRYQRLSGLAR